jgi:RimJ/RimL family protein N-acetyltransferase
MPPPTFLIRRATPEDGAATSRLLEVIVSERIYSAIDRAWTADEQAAYIRDLGDDEVLHVAVDSSGRIIGTQSLSRHSSGLASMRHVASMGTFILPEWRGRGVGRALFEATRAFGVQAGYRKVVIQVRGSNPHAQTFYRRMGFAECGRLSRQVVIDGQEDDELIMELFL